MKKALIKGDRFHFNNENHCINNESDQLRGAECWFDPSLNWHGGFKIEFNGALIHSSKTFASFQKRLNKLITTWGLELTKITNEAEL